MTSPFQTDSSSLNTSWVNSYLTASLKYNETLTKGTTVSYLYLIHSANGLPTRIACIYFIFKFFVDKIHAYNVLVLLTYLIKNTNKVLFQLTLCHWLDRYWNLQSYTCDLSAVIWVLITRANWTHFSMVSLDHRNDIYTLIDQHPEPISAWELTVIVK